jgi:hypothetical protein
MSISVSLNLSIDEALNATAQGIANGLNTAADRLVALSVPLTPIDLGDLRQGTIPTYAMPGELMSKVSNDLPYAARQHEELHWRHPKGGQAKYLEAPAINNATELMGLVGAAMRRSLRS